MSRMFVALAFALACALSGCAQSGSIFPDPGDNIATPNAMWVDVASNRLYLVNSNAEVLYDWTKGSFQVYDITDPLAPVLLRTTETPSFSGQVYVDMPRMQALIPNRFSTNKTETADALLNFNVDETSPDFMTFSEVTMGRDAYAISCCYPVDRVWVTTSLNELQYLELASVTTPGSIPLETALDNGSTLSHAEVNHIALKANQTFLSREYGGVMVVNLDEAGVAGSVPVDYLVGDVQNPRGIATDGTLIYVVGEGDINGNYIRFLLIFNPATLVPLTDNTTTALLDLEEDGLSPVYIQVGQNPQEVMLTTQYAFVTNQEDDTVSVISLATQAVVATITVGNQPFSLALYTTLAGVEQYVYVGNVEGNTISIIDIPSLSVVATYP